MWKLSWLLRDFDYDADLLKSMTGADWPGAW
jgi:hypothetical protein